MIGVFIDFTGQGQQCLTKEHNTIHIGHELDQPWIDAVARRPDAHARPHQGARGGGADQPDGRARASSRARRSPWWPTRTTRAGSNDVIVPALKKAKVKTGSTAILNITGTDTTAAQAQVDSFIEKWKTEGVNMVFLAGNLVSAKQFAESIKAGLPKATLVTDTDTALDQARASRTPASSPNPYEGMISGTGLTQSRAVGEQEPDPAAVRRHLREGDRRQPCPVPTSARRRTHGKQINTDQAVTDACGDLMMFKAIAEKVGPNLTTKNWQKTVDSFGTIDLPPNQFSSLCKGKYDAEDSFRLIAYDSSLGSSGDWKTLTPVKDASLGKCTKAAS